MRIKKVMRKARNAAGVDPRQGFATRRIMVEANTTFATMPASPSKMRPALRAHQSESATLQGLRPRNADVGGCVALVLLDRSVRLPSYRLESYSLLASKHFLGEPFMRDTAAVRIAS